MTSVNNQSKTIQFGVYKYEHPTFGPLMLLLDVDEIEQKQDTPQKFQKKQRRIKRPNYQFSDQQQDKSSKGNYLLNRYDSGQQQQKQKKRTLSNRPPIPGEKKSNKFIIGNSIEKIQRRSVERDQYGNKNYQNGLLLPTIVKKR